jgi:hypothetical protein
VFRGFRGQQALFEFVQAAQSEHFFVGISLLDLRARNHYITEVKEILVPPLHP